MMWTLEKELCKLSKSKNLQEALLRLKLIRNITDNVTITEDKEWERAGSETYIYRFWVKNSEISSGYVIKACVAFSPNFDIQSILQEWINRRQLMAQFGISTPKLITYGEGVVIEELIPYLLKDILVKGKYPSENTLIDLSIYAGFLQKMKFFAINPFDDLRSRDNDVVAVDYGQDLGPPNMSCGISKGYYELMIEKLNEWNVTLDSKLLNKMHSAYISIDFDSKQ